MPFYYSSCGGNENNFESYESCVESCPPVVGELITFSSKLIKFFKFKFLKKGLIFWLLIKSCVKISLDEIYDKKSFCVVKRDF